MPGAAMLKTRRLSWASRGPAQEKRAREKRAQEKLERRVYPPALRWISDYGFCGAIYQACRSPPPVRSPARNHVISNIPRRHLRGSEQRKA
jgi:hypothetical protein